jgi:CheY-like chemotaxis protein
VSAVSAKRTAQTIDDDDGVRFIGRLQAATGRGERPKMSRTAYSWDAALPSTLRESRLLSMGVCMASASRSNPRRVLVAEDEDSMATLVETMLATDKRMQVVGRARNGRGAVAMVITLDPDVILMDLQMPIMDGVEATRRLRELGSRARIVVLTGVEDVARIRHAREAGADAFVTKLPSAEDLIAVVLGEREQPD